MVEMKKQQKEKVNNKGMSLVEILVAIAILTVVSMGLLQAFVSAVSYNKQAKDKQRGINLAQTIMESYKAYTLEDICRQFNNVDPFVIYKGTHGNYSEAGGSVDAYGTFTPSVTNEYTFRMEDVRYDGKLFDVDITMQPNTVATSTEEVAKVPKFSAYNDAIFAQPADEYKYVYQDAINQLELADMKTELLPTVDTLDKTKITIDSRQISVFILNVSGVDQVLVQVTYKYTFHDYEFIKSDDSRDTLNSDHTVIVDQSDDANAYEVYNNSVTRISGAKLDNIFLYYYPAYDNELVGAECKEDSIVILNNSGVQRNVYLVKQVRPGLSDVGLFNSEATYKPKVSLQGSNGINLYHNLRKKLSGAGVALNSITYRPAGSAKDNLYEDWFEKENKILVYNVQVTVTDKQKGTVEVVLDGSINDR